MGDPAPGMRWERGKRPQQSDGAGRCGGEGYRGKREERERKKETQSVGSVRRAQDKSTAPQPPFGHRFLPRTELRLPHTSRTFRPAPARAAALSLGRHSHWYKARPSAHSALEQAAEAQADQGLRRHLPSSSDRRTPLPLGRTGPSLIACGSSGWFWSGFSGDFFSLLFFIPFVPPPTASPRPQVSFWF